MVDWNKEEKQKYDDVWLHEEYRQKCHSLTLWNTRRSLFPASFNSGLDICCGLGLLFWYWNEQGVDAWACDISRNCLHEKARKYEHHFMQTPLWCMLWERQFDVGVCTDVMEHIPTERVDDSLRCIADSCKSVVFKIAQFDSTYLGYDLHLTKESLQWWQDRMLAVGGKITHAESDGRPNHILVWEP